MSRTFSKILVICAMVAVFPLLIVGTAFASYYSINAVVEVSVFTNKESQSEDAFAKVVFGDKSDSKIVITQGHKTKINLKAVTNGYDFEGWFAGDLAEYTREHTAGTVNFISKEKEININMTDYEKLLAVYEIKEFDASYSYKANPNDTDNDIVFVTPETDDGDATSRTYNFGDVLPILSYEGLDYRFLGWKIVDDESNIIYTSANFSTNANITLTAVWQKQNKINVNYYLTMTDDTSLLKTIEIYENQVYPLETAVDVLTALKPEELKDGYKYSWQDKNGTEITTINTSANFNVYLKSVALNYNARLSFVDAGNTTFTGKNSVIFNAENATSLNDWFDFSKYNVQYSFYEVEGLEYEGQKYTTAADVATLSNKIIEKNPTGAINEIDVKVVLKKHFASFKVSGDISFKAADIGSSSYTLDVFKSTDLSSPWKVTNRTVSSEASINDLLNLPINVVLCTEDGKEVKLDSLTLKIGDKTITVSIENINSLNDIIEKILARQDITITTADTFNVVSIVANYDVNVIA